MTDKHEEPEWEELLEIQEQTRKTLRERGIPHIEIKIVNDFSPETPLSHTAYSYESLINTLLTIYATTGDERYIGLLGYTTSCIDNINALTAELIIASLREKQGNSIIEDMLKYMQSFHHHHNSEEETTEIPDAFYEAFKEHGDDDESR